jgi:hypothetical protein
MILIAELSSAYEAAWNWNNSGLTARVVRGHKMRSEKAMFDEFGAAFQFPYNFGENWPALDECLADLSWLPAKSAYVLLVTNARDVLAQEPTRDLDVLVRVLSKVAVEWATPVDLGEWWDRPGVPFHVVLQATPEDAAQVEARWTAAGAVVYPLSDHR